MDRWPRTGPIRYRIDVMIYETINDIKEKSPTENLFTFGDKFLYGPQDHVILYENDVSKEYNQGLFGLVPVYSIDTGKLAAVFFAHWNKTTTIKDYFPSYLSESTNAVRKRRAFLLDVDTEEFQIQSDDVYAEYGLKITPEFYNEWSEKEMEKVCLFEKKGDSYAFMVAMNFRKNKHPLDVFISLYAF